MNGYIAGGEDSMSTPNMSNMSFDSPIMVAKSFSTDADKETKDEDDAEKKLEEEKKAKKKDMFAPEADMFAEEYSVSCSFPNLVDFPVLLSYLIHLEITEVIPGY